jgi:hypothetical protein
MLHSSGARCCPMLIFIGVVQTVAIESKTMPFWGPTKPHHLLNISFKHQGWMVTQKGMSCSSFNRQLVRHCVTWYLTTEKQALW